MVTTIYMRDRLNVGSGVRAPRFHMVALTYGAGDVARLKIGAIHFRKTGIEQIAKDVGADVVYLQPMPEDKRGRMKERL